MKILTATAAWGSGRVGDFCHAVEGEVVVPGMVCDNPICGCDRSFSGLNSHKSTTIVRVTDVDLTIDDLEEAAIGFLESGGWAKLFEEHPEPDDGPDPLRTMARQLVEDSAEIADAHDEGVLLRPSFDRDQETWNLS